MKWQMSAREPRHLPDDGAGGHLQLKLGLDVLLIGGTASLWHKRTGEDLFWVARGVAHSDLRLRNV